ncbi:hypothetical protein AWB72_05149 [Caballeronia concitans]|uniref:Uncharacterized protein n=2 Tax=Caballeronia concitans TaxID=1777133 RepID=A0A658R479_9BURK|nr:hypothetical protein AWB72_05149 [Caballeronia concitans]
MHDAGLLPYQLRGNRVTPLDADEVVHSANRFCAMFRINRRTLGSMAGFIEQLATYHICVDLIEDEQWWWGTDAVCDPSKFKIVLPEGLYRRACAGERDAVSTLFHELGHLVLGHKALLHNEKSGRPTKEEDAEWQADLFSDHVLSRLGLQPICQLTLDFSEGQ